MRIGPLDVGEPNPQTFLAEYYIEAHLLLHNTSKILRTGTTEHKVMNSIIDGSFCHNREIEVQCRLL